MVEIDVEKFNEIELTHVDMFVTQKNVPPKIFHLIDEFTRWS